MLFDVFPHVHVVESSTFSHLENLQLHQEIWKIPIYMATEPGLTPKRSTINDGRSMINDGWWMMDDGWWMMDDGWWMMDGKWWMASPTGQDPGDRYVT